jgi:adiponectin receptor
MKIQKKDENKNLSNLSNGDENKLCSFDEIKIEQIKLNQEDNNKIIIGKFEDAPNFLQDNEYIRNGYLINCNTFKKIFKSLFKCSNETVNIWSHLLGSLLAIILIFYTGFCINQKNKLISNITTVAKNFLKGFMKDRESFISNLNTEEISYMNIILKKFNNFINDISNLKNIFSLTNYVYSFFNDIKDSVEKFYSYNIDNNIQIIKDSKINYNICKNNILEYLSYSNKNDNKLPRWPLFIMLSAGSICLGFSFLFHLFGVYSAKLYKILSKLDYGGILFLIAGSCYPPYYYFYYCEHIYQKIYLSFITIFSLCVFIYSLTPSFTNPNYRKIRGIIFLTIGISTAIPILHLAFFGNKIEGFNKQPKLFYWYFGGISYVFGGIMYTLRIPEKYFKNIFDYFGASHQILHTFVIIGFISHYLGCLDSYYYRIDNKCPV